MKSIVTLLAFICTLQISLAQSEVIPLWENIPNSQVSDEKEIYPERKILWIENVQTPTLEIFLPANQLRTGQAVVICPGGGYAGLAYDWEGTDFAKDFISKGIAAFVLKSRLPKSKSVKVSYEAPLQDAQRAIRIVRSNAKKWKVDPNKIGVMGFSAGGHLASTLGTQYDTSNNFAEKEIDKISARPDFMILIYPVITMDPEYTHAGSRRNLLGKKPSKKLAKQFSNELQVTENTPPTFILHTADDHVVPVENSLLFYKALKKYKVSTEMHLYPKGGHGFSFGLKQEGLSHWPDLLHKWMQGL